MSDKAANIIKFIESELEHVKGKRGPLLLAAWQKQFIKSLQGKNYAVVCVPRKNGKTTLICAIALYHFFCGNEQGAEIIFASTTRDQAAYGYGICCEMIRRNPRLKARCKILRSKKLIENPRNGTTLRAICSDAGTAQGLSPSLCVFDEVQEQGADRSFHDSLLTGMGARDKENRLFLSIGTASWDKTSLLWDLLQTPDSKTFLRCNYTTEKKYDDPTGWAEANPNYNISVKPDFLETECERAKRSPIYEGEFRRKYLGQWTENETRFLRMDYFRKCRGPLPDLRHQSVCVCAFDLASRRDSCSAVLAIYKNDVVYLIDKTWIPEDAVRQRPDIRFDLWPQNVWIEPGNIIDHRAIKDQILDWLTEYPVEKIGYDPFNASQTALELFQEGQVIEPISQGVGRMSEPTKLLEQLVFTNKLRYDSDLLEWEAQNLCCVDDNNGNIRPQKPSKSSPYRVDAMICVIMCLRLLFGWQMEPGPLDTHHGYRQ